MLEIKSRISQLITEIDYTRTSRPLYILGMILQYRPAMEKFQILKYRAFISSPLGSRLDSAREPEGERTDYHWLNIACPCGIIAARSCL